MTVSIRATAAEWLPIVHATNTIDPELFGKPTHVGPWWAGGVVEDYADARIIHREDDSRTIVSRTDRGDVALAAAAKAMNIHFQDSSADTPAFAQPENLHVGDQITLPDGSEHRLGNITFDRDTDSGELLRAAAFSHTADRWINLMTGTLK